MEWKKEKNKEQLHTFELLAPAGSPEILRAVIAAGADAVYVGGDRFGARAYANNFTAEELLAAIDYAHLYGRKLYLTVNTLLKNQELAQLHDYLLPFYEQGLDAVLVQDLGALQMIRTWFPDLPVHTSTQMTITGVEGVRLLQELGAERIVMAREASLEEMRQIHEETGAELEAFVHGALCYCYSGQCLFSSMLGGRSGNRGRCAQPCRLAYSVLDEEHREYRKESYILSLKDLCGIEQLRRLREAGVYSLKIEGRMKQMSYAAGVVSYYRKNIDRLLAAESDEQWCVDASDLRDVADLGNRCGFTHGYYEKKNGADMVTFQKPSYEKTNEALQEQIAAMYGAGAPKLPARGRLTLHRDAPAVYEVSHAGQTVTVVGDVVMEAQKKPLAAADVTARMQKTGDTVFVMEAVELAMDEACFLPNGALNRLRRDALSALSNALLAPYRRTCRSLEETPPAAEPEPGETRPRVVALTEKRSLLPAILGEACVTAVYLDFAAYDPAQMPAQLAADIAACKEAEKEVYFALPRIFRAETAAYFTGIVPELFKLPLDGFLVRTYGEIAYVRQYFPAHRFVTDHNLYTYNNAASAAFARLGAVRNTVPLELNRGEIRGRDNRASEMIVYGYYPLMTSAQCVHANTAGCDHRPGVCYLQDRYRTQFPVKNICGACYNVIYNSLPVLLFAQLTSIEQSGVTSFRLDFTLEEPGEVSELFALFRARSGKWTKPCTNGHYKRGVE